MFNFLIKLVPTAWGWLVKLGIGSLANLAFLGPIAPILTAIGQFIGSIISAIAEIIGAMARSYEGRIALAAIVAGFAGLYLRWHYILQGRAEAPVRVITKTVRLPAPPPIVKYVKLACPVQKLTCPTQKQPTQKGWTW